MTATDSTIAPWGSLALTGNVSTVELGDVHLDLKLDAQEIWWATRRGDAGPEEASWSRWLSDDTVTRVRILPCLPDLPVVVEPEVPLHLAPRSRARVFVGVPAWARVQSDDGTTVITEIPTKVLSETWWGDPTGGERAYGYKTRARRSLEGGPRSATTVYCPMTLVNDSEESLPVDRIAVRAPQLSVFGDKAGLWTNRVQMRFTNDEEGSEVEIKGQPPEEAASAELLVPPRSEPPRIWKVLTFGKGSGRGGFWSGP